VAIDKSDPVLMGAGDIARCRLGTFLWGSGADATASLLDGTEVTQFFGAAPGREAPLRGLGN
jgi:hypothetical protein